MSWGISLGKILRIEVLRLIAIATVNFIECNTLLNLQGSGAPSLMNRFWGCTFSSKHMDNAEVLM